MKRIVGLDREIHLRWLDLAASYSESEPDPAALRGRLMEALEAEIRSWEARDKTCTVLMRAWRKVPAEHVALRDQGYSLLKVVPPDQRTVLHWGMLLLAYPFFRETATLIGRAASAQATISRGQVQRKIAETWGERSTVYRAVNRMFQTLTGWGILVKQPGDRDTYIPGPVRQVTPRELGLWLVEAILLARASTMAFSELAQCPEIAPFRLAVTLADVTRAGRFETFSEGREVLVGVAMSAV